MNRTVRTLILSAGILTITGGALAFTAAMQPEDEEIVQLGQLPTSVQRTIREHAKGGDIEKIEQCTKDGKTSFEVEVESARGDYEFLVGSDGKYLGEDREEADEEGRQPGKDEADEADEGEHVEVIGFGDAPKSVQDAFLRLGAGVKPTRVERITQEETAKYEIEFDVRGQTASLTLAGTGDLMEREMPVAGDELPEAVRKEIMRDFPGAKIKAAEAVEVHYFEIEVVVHGQTHEVVALATGDIEDHFGPGGDDEDRADSKEMDHRKSGHHADQEEDEEDDDD